MRNTIFKKVILSLIICLLYPLLSAGAGSSLSNNNPTLKPPLNPFIAKAQFAYNLSPEGMAAHQSQPPDWKNRIRGVYASDDGKRIYACVNPGLMISSDAGAHWKLYTPADGLGSGGTINVYASQDGKRIYVATIGGLSVSNDAGMTWVNYTSHEGLVSDRTLTVQASDSGKYIYVGTEYGISISTNYGLSWQNIGPKSYITKIFVTNNGKNIYAAMLSGLAVSSDGGTNWTTYTTDDGFGNNNTRSVYASNDGQEIYVANDGGLAVSHDYGHSWFNYTFPETDNSARSVRISHKGKLIYVGLDGGKGSGLFISRDAGAHWQKYSTDQGLGNNNILEVYTSKDGERIYAATWEGLSISTDAGLHWINYRLPQLSALQQ